MSLSFLDESVPELVEICSLHAISRSQPMFLAVYAPINDEKAGIFSCESLILREENSKVDASKRESAKNYDKNAYGYDLLP